jgi:hypothetical protein
LDDADVEDDDKEEDGGGGDGEAGGAAEEEEGGEEEGGEAVAAAAPPGEAEEEEEEERRSSLVHHAAAKRHWLSAEHAVVAEHRMSLGHINIQEAADEHTGKVQPVLEAGYEESKAAPEEAEDEKEAREENGGEGAKEEEGGGREEEGGGGDEDEEEEEEEEDEEDEAIDAVAQAMTETIAPRASKILLPTATRMLDREMMGAGKSSFVRKKLKDMIEIAITASILLFAMSGLGKAKKKMAKQAEKLKNWVLQRRETRRASLVAEQLKQSPSAEGALRGDSAAASADNAKVKRLERTKLAVQKLFATGPSSKGDAKAE